MLIGSTHTNNLAHAKMIIQKGRTWQETYRCKSTWGLYGNKHFWLRLSIDVVNEAKQFLASINGSLKFEQLLLPYAWPSSPCFSSGGIPPSLDDSWYITPLKSLQSAKTFRLFRRNWSESPLTPRNSRNKLQELQIIRNDLAAIV